ncbi:MAG: zinc metalloprotease [Chitinophagales bacterium]|nr:zinc metalloprotease [Chitinophagales bacterium]
MNIKFIRSFVGGIIIFFVFYSRLLGQQADRCGTMEYLDQYEKLHPGTKISIKQVQEQAAQWILDHTSTRNIATIPVVVHVVYNTAAENISDDQIRSQIDVLNEDYQAMNFDTVKAPPIYKPLIGNAGMEFCLAAVDPFGNATTGIIRTSTTHISFDLDDSVKFTKKGGDDAWPSTKYMNIWVCNLTPPKLGFTTLPSGTKANPTDGVVVTYRAFGREGKYLDPRYNLGRTCTHEVGHWLGLTHIWGDDGGSCDGSDNIDDTPNQADANYGCVAFPHITCDNNGDMSMNYMDYSDDRCMYMFTIDQANEMIGILNTTRKSILSSTAGCNTTYTYSNDARINSIIVPGDTVKAQSFNPMVQIMNKGQNDLTFLHIEYQIDGQDIQTYDFMGNLPSGYVANITLPLAFTGEGGHIFTVWSTDPNQQQDQYLSNDTLTTIFTITSVVPKNTFDVSFDSPSSLNITIQNPGAPSVLLAIINSMGEVVYQKQLSLISQTTFNFDFADMATGVYFIQGKVGYYYTRGKFLYINPGR